jgi:phosphoglycerol transferase MdoB-like AlkP superfamily enzyme
MRKKAFPIYRLYSHLATRAYTVIMFSALFCTLSVKLFQSYRGGLINEYLSWIYADLSFLLVVELVMALICFRWPHKWVIRAVTVIAAIMCTWSVLNAAWLIRTGTQILPRVLLPLFRSPLNSLAIIGVNLIKMPKASAVLLIPSAVALTFFFFVLVKPQLPGYNRRRFIAKVIITIIFIITAASACLAGAERGSPQLASVDLRTNSQLRAVESLVLSDYRQMPNPERKIPSFDQLKIKLKPQRLKNNLVIVILEGIQYKYTSLSDNKKDLTPYLASLAKQGVEFTNTRTSLSHTTKALFTLFTGRVPSTSQDIAEAVPAVKPYASIATILSDNLNYRTAFFQSAKGDFECRPGLVYNLGFDIFWARDDLNDPNSFLGYLACDEFSMLSPITEWIKADERPFFLTILFSVTHDPYEVPEWFAEPDKEPVGRYQQAVFYTDKFLAALDVELTNLNLADKTILCVIGDHGEAFGEHGQHGHVLIAFDEVLRVPFFLRVPFLVEPGTKITEPVSSIDLVPTLLNLIGFETEAVGFDGVNVLGPIPDDRNVYFCDWMQEGPAGFVKGSRKFIYNPADKTVCVYDLSTDPLELDTVELPEQQARRIADEIISWRKHNIFELDQQRTGRKMLFDRWLCRWTNRISSAKYERESPE